MSTTFRIATGEKVLSGNGDDMFEVISIEFHVPTQMYWARTHEEMYMLFECRGLVTAVGKGTSLEEALTDASRKHIEARKRWLDAQPKQN